MSSSLPPIVPTTELKGKTILVTGGAGFIGSHLSRALLLAGSKVVAIDNFVPYYSVNLKKLRIRELKAQFSEPSYIFLELDLLDRASVAKLFDTYKFDVVCHLAAQAGVRYCEDHKEEALRINIDATVTLLEEAAHTKSVQHFVFASSSSVYGLNPPPWREDMELKPQGVYGNSKKRGEEICIEKSQDPRIPYYITGLRFFTVYGPTGRPDMAPGKFCECIHKGKKIPLFGDGTAIRDFTFVDDIVQGILKAITNPHPSRYQAFNLGKGEKHTVLQLIAYLEQNLGKKADIQHFPARPEDVAATQADTSLSRRVLGYDPQYTLRDGIAKTVQYYLRYAVGRVYVTVFSAVSTPPSSTVVRAFAMQSRKPHLVVLVVPTGTTAEQCQITTESLRAAGIHVDVISAPPGITDAVNSWHTAITRLGSAFTTAGVTGDPLAVVANPPPEDATEVFVSLVDERSVEEWANHTHWLEQADELVATKGSEVVMTDNGYPIVIRLDVLLQADAARKQGSVGGAEDLANSVLALGNIRQARL